MAGEFINLEDGLPAAPSNARNVKFQEGTPTGDAPLLIYPVSAYMTDMVGDTGSGGQDGLVPAPGAGDAAAGKYLKADGTWEIPPGSGSANFVPETPSGTQNGVNLVFTLLNAVSPTNSYIWFLNGVEQTQGVDIAVSGNTGTFTVAPKSYDIQRVIYSH